jgi:hypothetical protein
MPATAVSSVASVGDAAIGRSGAGGVVDGVDEGAGVAVGNGENVAVSPNRASLVSIRCSSA